MKLFKNKKGLDYSALMVIVVIIIVIYLFIQLYAKLDIFELRVGDQEFALINTYQTGDKISLFVDQAAKYSVHHALKDLGEKGGSLPNKLPVFALTNVPYWFKDNNRYYKDINFYDAFEFYLEKNLRSYLSNHPGYSVNTDYEFTIIKDKVLGIPIKPILLPLFVLPEKKSHYGDVMSQVFKDFGVHGTGIYAIRPSFSVNIETHIDDFELVAKKIDVLLDCIKSDTITNCIHPIQSEDGLFWNYVEYPDSNTIVFNVVLKNIQNPYDRQGVYVNFALEK